MLSLLLVNGAGIFVWQQSLNKGHQEKLSSAVNAIHAHADELFNHIHKNSEEGARFEAKAVELADVLASLPNDLHFKIGLPEPENDRFKLSFWEQNILNEMTASGLKVASGYQKDATGRFYYVARSESLRNGQAFIQVAYQYTQESGSNGLLYATLVGLNALVMLVFNVLAHVWVFRPLGFLVEQATAVSKGDGQVQEIDGSGQGELSELAEAFNRLQRSLKAAMNMLS